MLGIKTGVSGAHACSPRPVRTAGLPGDTRGMTRTRARLASPCSIQLISVDWRRRVDDVGCLPQPAGYPLPRPHLPQLLRQLREQLAQRRQVQHSRLTADVHYPSGSRGLGRAARLISDAPDDDVAKPCSVGRAYVLASRGIRGCTWLRILGHPDHPTFAGWSA
jgi:hypothetical protein